QGHQVTVVAVDLDGLKRINDTEGHAAGDAALLALVRAFYSAHRDEDTVFRVGGDEFVILLPFTSVDAAQSLMLRIQGAGAPEFTWGAAGFPGAGAEAAALVEAADQDLYRRRQGRRRLGAAIATQRVVHLGPRRVQRLWRWAWIPAAAVLVASMVATFVTSGTPGPFASATRGGHRASPASYPAGAAPAAGTGRGSGTTSPSSPGGVQAAELGYESSVGNTGSAGAPTSSPPGSAPPGPLAPGSSGGGILGTLQQAVAPVPVVGGGNGLLAKLTQLLSPTPASAGSSDRSPTPGVLSLAQPFGF
ncbi:MAG TPA: diguanylate cyclase, partial [Acidimicrobiales bacterium]|nr:diguanylate cyclase [Acidimicrobiales bacterium]